MSSQNGRWMIAGLVARLVLAVIFLVSLDGVSFADPAEQVKIDMHHLIIKEQNGLLEVHEIINFINSGEPLKLDKTLPEEEQMTLEISLPYYFKDLIVLDGIEKEEEAIQTEKGMGLAREIPAGEYSVELFYNVNEHNGDYLLNKEIIYETDKFYLLLAEDLSLTGKGIVYAGSMPMGEKVYNQYYLENSTIGDQLDMTVTKSPGTGSDGGSSFFKKGYSTTAFHSPGHIRFWYNSPFKGVGPHAFLAVVVAGIFVGLGVYVKKWNEHKEKDSQPADQDDQEFKMLLAKQKILLAKIGEAKEELEQGKIDQETFEKIVSLYKEKLTKVKVKLKLLSD